jgi:hypothetical protein
MITEEELLRKAAFEMLLKTVENLKCCGNCKLDKDCTNWANYCDKWVSDGMTRKEREE